MKIPKSSISLKLVFIISLILFLFGAATITTAYLTIETSNMESIDKEIYETTTILARTISTEEIKAVLADPQPSNSHNVDMTKLLDDLIAKSQAISNAYIVSTRDGALYMPGLNSSLLEGGLQCGQQYDGVPEYNQAAKATFESKEHQRTVIYEDEFGMWKTGFAPVFGENGDIIALIGVDFNVSKIIAKVQSEVWRFVILIAIFLVVSAFIVYFVVRRMIQPVVSLAAVSRKIADGDLRVNQITVKSKDEIGQLSESFNIMVQNLKMLVERVGLSACEVEVASKELTSGIQQSKQMTTQITDSMQEIAAGSDNQYQSSQESAKAMEEMAAGIQRIAETSGVVAEGAAEMSKGAERGNDAMERTVRQMNAISHSVRDSAKLIQHLGERSQEIGQFVEVISGISAQTNLLALNAAIEAARAGEHGRGFAVVADEVRKLAEQSDVSARHISTIIQEIQGETSKAVHAMDTVTKEVGTGLTVAVEAGEMFKQIYGSAQTVAGEIQEISAASEQMSASTQEITASVEEMAKIAKDSAENTRDLTKASGTQLRVMDQIAVSSDRMDQLVNELNQVVKSFKV